MIIAISENKDGLRFVEIHKDRDGFRILFPQDMNTDSVPLERLEQLKSALEDVIWQKGRYTPIPEATS